MAFPPLLKISTIEQSISTSEANICLVLIGQYLAGLPVDPQIDNGQAVTDCGEVYDTGYTIAQSSDNSITVRAPRAELSKDISATR